MSWQEELQKLDSALATGRIAADDYRKRRDELLAQASQASSQPAQPAAQQPVQEQPPQEPPAQEPAQQQTPFPPAFKWQPGQPSQSTGGGADSTTIIPPVSPPPAYQPGPAEPERTQVVGQQGPSDSDRTQVVSGADRTQVVPNYVTNSPPGGFPQVQQQPPWGQQQQHQHQQQPASPPWAGDDLPPGFGQVGTSWPRQGPEIFEEKSKGKGKIIGIVAGVVVVLGAAAAIFFITQNSSDSPPSSDPGQSQAPPPPPATQTTPTSTGPKLPDGPFVQIVPGDDAPAIRDNVPIEDAIAQKAPTEAEAKLLQQAGTATVSSVVSIEGELTRGIWAFTPAAGSDPKAILTEVNKLYQQAGHKQLPGTAAGVTVWNLPADAGNKTHSYRAHFITDGKVVRVEAYGPDATASKDAFDELLQRVTQKFPPTQ